jgi:hypothetical protein
MTRFLRLVAIWYAAAIVVPGVLTGIGGLWP